MSDIVISGLPTFVDPVIGSDSVPIWHDIDTYQVTATQLATYIGNNMPNAFVGGQAVLSSTLTVSGVTTLLNGLNLSNPSSNFLIWDTAGVGPPTTTVRSSGTKTVMYPALSSTQLDYAIGVDNQTLWFSTYTPSGFFKWYSSNGNAIATLDGFGNLTTSGSTVALGSITALQSIVSSGSIVGSGIVIVPSGAIQPYMISGGTFYGAYTFNAPPTLSGTNIVAGTVAAAALASGVAATNIGPSGLPAADVAAGTFGAGISGSTFTFATQLIVSGKTTMQNALSVSGSISAIGGVFPGNGSVSGIAGDFSGSGVPTFSAANGSTYRRVDGTSTPLSTLFYVNVTGPNAAGTAWAPIAGSGSLLAGAAIANIGLSGLPLSYTNLGWFNVQDPQYGATGRGINDDSVAIASGITVCAALGGGTVYIPQGTYAFGSLTGLTAPATVRILGAGSGSTIFVAISGFSGSTFITGVSGCTIEGIGFDMQSMSGVASITVSGAGTSAANITRCGFANPYVNGTFVQQPVIIQSGLTLANTITYGAVTVSGIAAPPQGFSMWNSGSGNCFTKASGVPYQFLDTDNSTALLTIQKSQGVTVLSGLTTGSYVQAGTTVSATVSGVLGQCPPVYTSGGTALGPTAHAIQGTLTATGASTTIVFAIPFASATYSISIFDRTSFTQATVTAAPVGSITFTSTNTHVYSFLFVGV